MLGQTDGKEVAVFEKSEGYPYLTTEQLNGEMGRFVYSDPLDFPYPDYILYSEDYSLYGKDGTARQILVALCDCLVYTHLAEALGLKICDIGGPGEDEEDYYEQRNALRLEEDEIYPKEIAGGFDWATTDIRYAVVYSADLSVAAFTTTEEAAKVLAEQVLADGSPLYPVRISDICS